MLRFLTSPRSAGLPLSRREWLRVGLGGLAALASRQVPARGSSHAGLAPRFGRAKSVLVIYASGGQSQIDIWDPKPDAPLEVRGEFRSIATALPGTHFGEHIPKIGQVADRFSLVRTMSHDDLDHGSATYLALTGHFHARKSSNPPVTPNDLPTIGAVVKRVQPADRFPYTAVHLNGPAMVPSVPAPGQNAGLLGPSCDPLILGDLTSQTVALPGLEERSELPPVRQQARQSLLSAIDGYAAALERDSRRLEMDVLYRQAYELLAAPHCRRAFDLDEEPAAVRDRYGRHRSGAACLLARRLIEAGVPLVNVIWCHSNRGQDDAPDDTEAYGWDTHNDIFVALRKHLLPRFDQTLSTLLVDLDERGLLDETLVVCMGEFGRAPNVALEPRFAGSSPGRKHWAAAYSILAAGAGVARGRVVGKTDPFGGYPATTPYSPGDLAATMFAALGIDPSGHYTDLSERPYAISTGHPIEALY